MFPFSWVCPYLDLREKAMPASNSSNSWLSGRKWALLRGHFRPADSTGSSFGHLFGIHCIKIRQAQENQEQIE